MIGRTLSHYKILAEISRGGMGVVYRGVDLKLDREVALKVLPPELVADSERKRRFVQEAKAAAALEHPHIAVVYEIDEAEDVTFIVMELIRGEKLRDIINKEVLPVTRTLELATEVAEGLALAHDKGVVHRDLKPTNIMVTENGHAKIIDFGLAKLVEPLAVLASEVETALRGKTESGIVMGTVAYMSPEQARGQNVDHRSDIFSFGTVLHEMLTGETPFKAPSGPEILNAIINTPAPPLRSSVVGDVTPELQRVVDKCLRKDPAERYQTMKDMVVDLRDARQRLISAPLVAAAVQSDAKTPSIAILPFSDMSPQKDQDYFCEGMAEEIINALSKIEDLRVAARTSAFQFKGKAEDIGHIGEALKVKTLLEGSVRTSGNRLRVTAQLINVADGYHLWSERYDREIEDVFDIQDEITQSIVEALRVKLLGDEEGAKEKRHSEKLEAYHLYLKGRYYWYSREGGGQQKAVRFFEQAVEEDPSYGLAYVGLADSYSIQGLYGFLPSKVAFPKAKSYVERALSLDDRLAEAHTALGLIRMWFDWDWNDAEREFKRALELKPTHVEAYCGYGHLFSYLGRHDEAIAMMMRALEKDPLSPFAHIYFGVVLNNGRQYEKATEELQKALDVDPSSCHALWPQALSYSYRSMHDKAVIQCQKAVTLSNRFGIYLGLLGWAYGLSGRRDEAREVLEELLERSRREYVPPISLAHVCIGLKEKDKAFEWLERAYQERAGYLVLLKVDPSFDPLRSDPRFDDLLRRVNLVK